MARRLAYRLTRSLLTASRALTHRFGVVGWSSSGFSTAWQRGARVGVHGFDWSAPYLLQGRDDEGAHRCHEALTRCDLAEEALGPASHPPLPDWLSS